ncbi:hypothetical protein EXIGLDRAFT_699508 [Exidia glandulosa HHB12029]|uniref:Uncharacterized protein n=1 Tax=Exidia glandulosa HHB12029 TaxID=1314781 RepID=A0A165DUG9_EXIGL|nr:hypothetical protein EXIGLDRAFT_699508 [Exidia glandulosa HHB12029]
MDGSSSTATAPPSSPTETRNKQARKERMKNILEEGRNIATIMQGIAETNPVTKGCVVTFSTLITLEINRKENDEEIVKAVQRMIRMVEALSALTLPLMNDESLASRLQAVLAAMERKMEYFKTFCTKYYNNGLSRRFFSSGSYKTQLQTFITAFGELRDDLVALLTASTAVNTKDILDKIEAFADSARLRLLPGTSASLDSTLEDDTSALTSLTKTVGASAEDVSKLADHLSQLSEHVGDAMVDADQSFKRLDDLESEATQVPLHITTAIDDDTILLSPTGTPSEEVTAGSEDREPESEPLVDFESTSNAGQEIAENMYTIHLRLEAMDEILQSLQSLLAGLPTHPSRALLPPTPAPSLPSALPATDALPPAYATPTPPAASISPSTLEQPLRGIVLNPAGQYTCLLNNKGQQGRHHIEFEWTSDGPDHLLLWTVCIKGMPDLHLRFVY